MSDLEVRVQFSDLTLIQGSGSFDKIFKIMENQFPKNKWTIKSNVMIYWNTVKQSPVQAFGVAFFAADFKYDKTVIITASSVTSATNAYSRDMQSFSVYLQQNGWNRPQPKEQLVQQNKIIWRRYWQTWLVDSVVLDKKFGKRM